MHVSAAEPSPEQHKLLRDYDKFRKKHYMATTGLGLGGKKKRTMKKRNIKRRASSRRVRK
jgi:hypothetical protein